MLITADCSKKVLAQIDENEQKSIEFINAQTVACQYINVNTDKKAQRSNPALPPQALSPLCTDRQATESDKEKEIAFVRTDAQQRREFVKQYGEQICTKVKPNIPQLLPLPRI